MDDELTDDSVFLLTFPVWTLLHPTTDKPLLVNGPAGESGFPIFTDQDLAERFRKSVPPLAHYQLHANRTRGELRNTLLILKGQGVEYVALDPTNSRTRFTEISTALRYIRVQQGDGGGGER